MYIGIKIKSKKEYDAWVKKHVLYCGDSIVVNIPTEEIMKEISSSMQSPCNSCKPRQDKTGLGCIDCNRFNNYNHRK